MRSTSGKLRTLWTTVGGLRMHARVSADPSPIGAPDVVLLHGLGVSSRYMVPTAERLAPFCRVLAPDLPGFGQSDKPDRTLDVPELADALASWMDAVGLSRAALLANSFGCQIAVEHVLRHPGRLTRLVLAGPSVDRTARSMIRQIWGLAIAALCEPPPIHFVVLREYWDSGFGRSLATLHHAVRDRPEEKLPRVEIPALVVRGSRDPLVSQGWAEEWARLFPLGRLVVLPGAAHAVNYSNTEELVRVVLPFLRGEVRMGKRLHTIGQAEPHAAC